MIPFKKHDLPPVTEAEMQAVYEQLKTPYKYGAVMKLPEDHTDSPSVFFHEGRWYLYFISISKDHAVSGYETHLAVSDDLLHWEKVSTIFKRDGKNRWDSKQCAGYAAFPTVNWPAPLTLQPVNGRYYISYLAGNSDGYEPDPLYMGLAYAASPLAEFTRFPAPILRPDDADAREKETRTLYRSFLFHDEARITGYPYVNVYNGKSQNARERIYCAVSGDGEHWERYGDRPLIDEATGNPDHLISGDAQIIKMGDLYVMAYFRHGKVVPAYDTFACSRDFVHWTTWQGEPLVKSTEPWDDRYAHKPWLVCKDGVVYHYYCACNTAGERFIALATSRDLKG